GTTYDVQARGEDGAGNFSEPSALVAATPRLTRGFWATYRNAGGAEQGGCSAVHGLPLLLAGGLWLLRRKRN
ncbi:MAG: fibronectin type domain protein, partial [Myxococcaceae bacterium]|nr:fibronectin type domain protein [Myxococcaceae bacterium]